MKIASLLTIVSALIVSSARADVIWQDTFNYSNGPVSITSTNGSTTVSNWITHSGNLDCYVNNHRLEVSSSSTYLGVTFTRSGDVNRQFATAAGSPYTNVQQVIYTSFIINFTNLPTANGAYFAHLKFGIPSASSFEGRLFALTGTTNDNLLPNTFRLGVSASQSTSPSKVFPIDLALNTDYQVVLGWDPVTLYAMTLWINPVSPDDGSVISGDAYTPSSANIANSFAFRQASGFGGFVTISNLVIATTFDEAATNVWSTNAVSPTIVYAPQSRTNFVGDNFNVSAVANGQSLSTLIYQWRKNGANFSNPNGNTNALTFVNAQASDSGNYDLIVSNIYGLSVTSSVAFIWVTNPPIPPVFTQQPSNQTVYPHQTATLTVAVSGSDPTFQWYQVIGNVTNPVVASANFSDPTQPTLQVIDVQTNNGTVASYLCYASNSFGTRTSNVAAVTLIFPPATNIAYLRSLVDSTKFLPTNTTAYWTVTGVVTTHTNLTAPPNLSIAIQDDTAGIGVFMAGGVGAGIFPQAGDKITVTGPLGNFNGTLQLTLNASDLSTTLVTNSSNNPLPAPIVLPLTFTNGVGFGGVSNLFQKYVGSLIMFTNVYFTDGPGTYGSGQITETITNSNGDAFRLFFNAATTPAFTGQPIPAFAWSVSGVLVTFLSPSTVDRSSGFEVDPTLYSDIVSTPPLQSTGAIALASSKPLISWDVQPNTSYSIFSSTNVSGPYSPLATGLTFDSATTTGHFWDTNASAPMMFYRIVSP